MKLLVALAGACSIACSIAYASHLEQKPLLASDSPVSSNSDESKKLEFGLKHVLHFGSTRYPGLQRRLDIRDTDSFWTTSEGHVHDPVATRYTAQQRPTRIQRLQHREPTSIYEALSRQDYENDEWSVDEVQEPDVTDKETVLSFARMANDAYYLEPGTGEWVDVGHGYNYTEDFGWEEDGLRGHIFADTTNHTVVIAMKGTSLPFKDPRGTISNDKLNDNLLFSCCCGQGGRWLWHQVCDCQTDYHVGNSTCISKEIREKTRYYHLGLELYHNITELYPKSNVWLAGHSLGGSIASLLGYTVGQPAITFEAAAEAMAAERLGLPTPPGFRLGNDTSELAQATASTHHFGHSADDIFMGNCNAWNSVCTIGGYAMEAKCHTGSICIYDTVKDKGWGRNARSNHGIGLVIKDVIESYDELAECKKQTDCRDCDDWHFFDG